MFGTRHRSTESMTSLADHYCFSGTSSTDTNPFKEKGRHNHLWNIFQGRLVFLYIFIYVHVQRHRQLEQEQRRPGPEKHGTEMARKKETGTALR